MPYYSDLCWYNLPDVLLAYQPQYAPGSYLARHNRANGESNRFRLASAAGGDPAFASPTGWTFSGTYAISITNLSLITTAWTLIVAGNVTGTGGGGNGRFAAGTNVLLLPYNGSSQRQYQNGNSGMLSSVGPISGRCSMGFSGLTAYRNGVADGTIPGGTISSTSLVLGNNTASGGNRSLGGSIFAAVLYMRELAAPEMQLAMRQMTNLNNPDWSVWSRKRRYYYMPSATAAAAFQASWVRNSNSVIQANK